MNEGLFIRAGAGYSVFAIDAQYSGEEDSDSYSGYGFLGGVGYGLWLGEHFNLCLNFDYTYQTYSDDEGPDNSHFWIVYVSFYWF